MNKKLTPMKAIKAKCTDCIVDPLDKGTHIQQIENCPDSSCALHEHRPLTARTRANIKQERINNMNPMERCAYEAKSEKARKNMESIRGRMQ